MSAIHLFSGKKFDISNFNVNDYSISDIVIGLTREPRFGGQSNGCISVLTHVINGYDTIDDYFEKYKITNESIKNDVKFSWLMHDAGEGLLKDIPSPIKAKIPQFTKYEHKLMKSIAKKYNFTYPSHEIVDKVDYDQVVKEISDVQNMDGICINEPTENLVSNIYRFLDLFDHHTNNIFVNESSLLRNKII